MYVCGIYFIVSFSFFSLVCTRACQRDKAIPISMLFSVINNNTKAKF